MQVQRSEIPSLARSSCKRCHGRGIEGVTLEGREIVCRCVKSTLRKAAEQKVATGEVEGVPPDRQEAIRAKHKYIRDRIGLLQKEIADAQREIDEHPLQLAVRVSENQVECNRLAWERREREAALSLKDARGLEADAAELIQRASQFKKEADRRDKDARATLELIASERARSTAEDELAILRKKLNTATHQLAKKSREKQKTGQRLQAKLPESSGNGDSHG